jgi:hypothetical protein
MNSTEVPEEMARLEAGGPDDRRSPVGPVGVLCSVASLNLGLRFVVEVATIASLGYWGASVNSSVALRALLAVVTPLAAIVAWSRLLAPRAPGRLTGLGALTVELSIFSCATWALTFSGMGLVAVIYASLAVVNSLLTRALGQFVVADFLPAQGSRP